MSGLNFINRGISFLTIVIVCCFFSPTTYAQANKMDSLSLLIEKEVDILKKVDLLNQLSRQQIFVNQEAALKTIAETISLAKKEGYETGEALARKNRGILGIVYQDYEAAEEDLLAARSIYTKLGEQELVSKTTANLGVLYEKIGAYDKAIAAQESSISYAKSNKDYKQLANAYGNISNIQTRRGFYEEAIAATYESLYYDSLTNNVNGQAITLINLSEIFRDRGEYHKAISTSLKGLKKAEKVEDERSIYWALSTIGLIYKDFNDQEHALEYLVEAYEMAKKLKDDFMMGASLSNIGQLYEKIELDSAIVYLERAVEKFENTPDEKARAYVNLGGIYIDRKKDFRKAEDYLKKGLAIGKEIESKPVIDLCHFNFGALHQSKLEFSKSIDFYQKSIASANETGDLEILRDAYKGIAASYFGNKEWTEGQKSIDLFVVFSDSLLGEERITRAEFLDFEVEKEKLEGELKLQAKAQQVQSRNYLLIASGLGLLALGLFAFQWYRGAQAEKRQGQRIAQLSDELHHRVKNNLANVSGILSLKEPQVKDEEAKEILRSIRDRIIVIERIHSLLYKKNNGLETELKSYLRQLLDELLLLNEMDDVEVGVNIEVSGLEKKIESAEAIQIALIANEVITNAFKHALKENSDPKIAIKAIVKEKELDLEIFNNGRPLPVAFEIEKLESFGLKWVNGICENMGWDFAYDSSEKGVLFKFKMGLKD